MSRSYVHGTASVPLQGETIGAVLDRVAAEFGDRDALISCHQNLRYTYAQLLDQVNCAARGLLALGVKRGDRVGIWSANVAEWVIIQYAAAKAGAILVNINPAYRSRELEYALNQSGVSVLVTARSFRKTDYLEMLLALAPELADARGASLVLDKLPYLRHLIFLGDGETPGGTSWQQFMCLGEQVSPSALREVSGILQFDDPVDIQYTSGNYRLFMVPGLAHCSGGVGPVHFGNDADYGSAPAPSTDPERDMFAALERWVEHGIAPDRLIGSGPSPLDPTKTLTRPLCPHPQQAKYKGAGDTNDAANFACGMPAP